MPSQAKTELDLDLVRTKLSFNPETGLFVWLSGQRCGAPAGYIGNRGYVKIHVGDEYWLAHRLAWAFTFGALPKPPFQIDHNNRVRHDNRICNLRDVLQEVNAVNSDRYEQLPPAGRGATFLPRDDKWQAQISIFGIHTYLGRFETREAAHEIYVAAAAERREAIARLIGAAS
jgi:hypothetical protein